jgi:hypothetical protein
LWEENSSYWIFFPRLYPGYLFVEGIKKCFLGITFGKKHILGTGNPLKRALFVRMVLILLFGIEIAD